MQIIDKITLNADHPAHAVSFTWESHASRIDFKNINITNDTVEANLNKGKSKWQLGTEKDEKDWIFVLTGPYYLNLDGQNVIEFRLNGNESTDKDGNPVISYGTAEIGPVSVEAVA